MDVVTAIAGFQRVDEMFRKIRYFMAFFLPRLCLNYSLHIYTIFPDIFLRLHLSLRKSIDFFEAFIAQSGFRKDYEFSRFIYFILLV